MDATHTHATETRTARQQVGIRRSWTQLAPTRTLQTETLPTEQTRSTILWTWNSRLLAGTRHNTVSLTQRRNANPDNSNAINATDQLEPKTLTPQTQPTPKQLHARDATNSTGSRSNQRTTTQFATQRDATPDTTGTLTPPELRLEHRTDTRPNRSAANSENRCCNRVLFCAAAARRNFCRTSTSMAFGP